MDLMTRDVFGRTNERVPRLWFGLMTGGGDPSALVEEVCSEPAVVDVSGNAGMFGHLLHGKDVQIATFGGWEIAQCVDAASAANMVGAHLVETLSSLGRESIDYYFLRVRGALTEDQINGALNVLDEAKTDGVIRFLGLYVDGPLQTVMGMWRFHDAFEAVMVPRHPLSDAYGGVKDFALEKRVGVATSHPFNWGKGVPFFELPGLSFEQEGAEGLAFYASDGPVLVGVRSAEEVKGCREALSRSGQDPARFAGDYEAADFGHLAGDSRGWVREAVRRLG